VCDCVTGLTIATLCVTVCDTAWLDYCNTVCDCVTGLTIATLCVTVYDTAWLDYCGLTTVCVCSERFQWNARRFHSICHYEN